MCVHIYLSLEHLVTFCLEMRLTQTRTVSREDLAYYGSHTLLRIVLALGVDLPGV